ncbi:MAG TPA: T9SS type A sorting domain-containing protein [Bacteroidota bacterium]|nr:T9SS type A sorting domain-containing protein [Bacteroidota bacterium]
MQSTPPSRTLFAQSAQLALLVGCVTLISGMMIQPGNTRHGLTATSVVDTLRGSTRYGSYVIIRTDTSFFGTVVNGTASVYGIRRADTLELQRVTIGGAQFSTKQRYIVQSSTWQTELVSISSVAHSLARAKQKVERAGWSLPSSVLELIGEILPGENNPVCESPVAFPVRFEFFYGSLTGSFTIYPGCIAIIVPDALTDFTDVEVYDGGVLLSLAPDELLNADINADSVVIRGTVDIDGDVRAGTIRLDGSTFGASLTAGGVHVGDRMEVVNGTVDLSGTLRVRRSQLSGGSAQSIALRENSRLLARELNAEALSSHDSQISIRGNAKVDILSLSSSRMTVELDLESNHLTARDCPFIAVDRLRVVERSSIPNSGEATFTSSTLSIAADAEVAKLTLNDSRIARSNQLLLGTLRASQNSSVSANVLRTRSLAAELSQFNVSVSLSSSTQPARVVLDSCSVVAGRIDVGTFDASRTVTRTALLIADTLLTDRVKILTPSDSCRINVAQRSRLINTSIPAKRIHASLGNAFIDSRTHFDSDEGGGGPRWGLVRDESEAGGRVPTYTGASYGGYGGTFGELNSNYFIPADEPVGSPVFSDTELLEGLGGYPTINTRWSNYDTEGGKGGGIIRIDATDLVLDGIVSANGGMGIVHRWQPNRTGQGRASGGGSGGTIFLNVRGALSGSGRIEANGGKGKFGFFDDGTGSGGSGGRIRINYASNAGWNGSVKALGGEGGWFDPVEMRLNVQANPTMIPPWADSVVNGGPGTIYWKHSSGIGKILIDGSGGLKGGMGKIEGEFPEDTVEVRNATVVTNVLKARALVLRDSARLMPDNPYVRLVWPIPRRYKVPDGYGLRTGLSTTQNIYPDAIWKDSLQEVVSIEIRSDIVIDPTSSIDLTGFGMFGRKWTTSAYAGGSHGGYGGFGARQPASIMFGRSSLPYGDPREPLSFGEGGMGSWGYRSDVTQWHYLQTFGGSGGGVLRILCGGTVRVNGAIRADGASGSGDISGLDEGTGGGAGGSIWLSASSLAGSGIISASGGDGRYDAFYRGYGGGGGGGRIRIDYGDKALWTGKVMAVGGRGGREAISWSDLRNNGGPGTVYWNQSGGEQRIEISDEGGHRGLGYLSGILSGFDVDIRSAVVATEGLAVRNLSVRDSAILAGNDYRTALKLFPADAFPTLRFPLWEDRGDRRVQIRASGNVTVDNTGAIDFSGLGFYGRQSNYMPGGSHGGRGGTGAYQTTLGRPTPTYGDSVLPVTSGLGGYGVNSAMDTYSPWNIRLTGAGASGGGALSLVVRGILRVDGKILADGFSAIPQERGGDYGAGGGAGGSVLVRAASVTGSGIISASGGSGVFIPSSSWRIWGGGGGGGRLAVYGDLSSFTGTLRAAGGDGGSGGGVGPELYRGEPGTIVTGLTAPPMVGSFSLLRTFPANGDSTVSRTMPIRLFFNRSIDVSSFTFACSPDPGGWTVHWNITSDTLTLTHAAFDTGRAYAFAITAVNDLSGNALPGLPIEWRFSTGSIVTTAELNEAWPRTFALHQNYPNPFNPQTRIRYELPEASHVTLKVYDLLGREVRTLVDEFQTPGVYTALFSAEDLASGVYLYRLQVGAFTMTRKLLIIQ